MRIFPCFQRFCRTLFVSENFFLALGKLNASFFLGLSLSRKPEKDLISSLGEALSSLRLTIGLLIVLAVVSIFGTVIPQNAAPEEYLRVYKFATYRILHILGLLDMYRSWWFVLLLSLLCLNLIACSVGRFRLTLRLLSQSRERLEEPDWKSLSPKKSLPLKGLPVVWVSSVRDGLARRFRAPKVLEEDGTGHFFAEKGKLSRFGVYFVHVGVLVILGGALIGFFYGFRGNINLVEGETAGRVILRNGGAGSAPRFQAEIGTIHGVLLLHRRAEGVQERGDPSRRRPERSQRIDSSQPPPFPQRALFLSIELRGGRRGEDRFGHPGEELGKRTPG